MNADFDNATPIYLQLVEQLEREIISGKILPGERLPSVRELALRLKVNPNTVQKSLTELENSGLIFTERTNGKFVTEDAALIEKYKEEYADILTQTYINAMQTIGLDKADIAKRLIGLGGNE